MNDLLYVAIGIFYVIINGTLRKLYSEDDDWFLPLAHILVWPLFVLGLIITLVYKFSLVIVKWIGKNSQKS